MISLLVILPVLALLYLALNRSTTSTRTLDISSRTDRHLVSFVPDTGRLTSSHQATVEESWMDPEDMKSIADGADEDETEADAAGGGGDEGMRAV
jgi:hypothetical protein